MNPFRKALTITARRHLPKLEQTKEFQYKL